MAIDGSALNSDDLRATSVACHGCRTMGSSEAPISSHKSSTSRSFSAIGRLLSSFSKCSFGLPRYAQIRQIQYRHDATTMVSLPSPGKSGMFVRANKSSGRQFAIQSEPTTGQCHMEDGNCRQSRLGGTLDIPAAGPVLQGSRDRTGRFAVR